MAPLQPEPSCPSNSWQILQDSPSFPNCQLPITSTPPLFTSHLSGPKEIDARCGCHPVDSSHGPRTQSVLQKDYLARKIRTQLAIRSWGATSRAESEERGRPNSAGPHLLEAIRPESTPSMSLMPAPSPYLSGPALRCPEPRVGQV
jgi:hypothetical protein